MNSSELSNLSVEPSAIRQLTDAQKERLTEILDRYLSAIEQGMPLNPDQLKQENPEIAEQLQLYFERLDSLHEISAGFQNPEPKKADDEAPSTNEKRLGDFILGEEIGRGGMGVVYEAHQISLARRVALKVLPFAAVLDSKQIARFKNEAKAAAQLLHPNIVPVFAVGSERGVHYYAMQLIEGQPLDRAIAELRGKRRSRSEPSNKIASKISPSEPGVLTDSIQHLSTRSFLSRKANNRQDFYQSVMRLGIQAAEALHAAHEFGVVHRDIKPSNLLLDKDGKLWVTDFGLARIQSDATLSRTGDVVGTMRYMSPEQAHGQSALVDHRTDVYSLGVTLYELLALQPVFPEEDRPALLRQIDQHEPQPLSKLCPGIPVDLETVVLKAMAKLRDERYTTSQQFADDLRRVLEGKPTLAKPPTLADRLAKFTRRHRRIVTAAAVVGGIFLVASAVATFVISREKDRAERNFLLAERNFHDARAAVDELGALVAESLVDVPGLKHVRREVLQKTLKYYQGFVEQAGNDPSARDKQALTYSKIGTLAEELGSTQEAIDAHENAARLFGALAAENPQSTDYRRRLAVCQNNLAMVLGHTGRMDEARKAFREAIRVQENLVTQDASNRQYLGDLALSHSNLGLLLSEVGEGSAAEASLLEAKRLQENLVRLFPDEPETLRSLAASLNNLSALYVGDQTDRAIKLYERALDLQMKAWTARPKELKYLSDVALTCNNLGAAQARLGKVRDAEDSYLEAIEYQKKLMTDAPAQQSYRRDLAVSHNNLGRMQSQIQRPADAEGSFRTALDLQLPLIKQHPDDVGLRSSVGGVYNNLGIVLEELQRDKEAADSYKEAIEHQRVAFKNAADVSRYRQFLSKHYFNYGRVLRGLGRTDEAVKAALARRELWKNDPQRLLSVAEELAIVTKQLATAQQPVKLSADKCANYAVDVLSEAVEAGLKLPADFGHDGTFAAIKNHARFNELISR